MPTPHIHHLQKGVSLIEAMIAILIFSMAIIALMGLQGVAITNTAAAKYRTEASFFADQIISQMWAGGGNANLGAYACNPCTLANGNADTQAWVAQIQTGPNNLPNAATFPPSIVIAGQTVTVTVSWLAQSEIRPPAAPTPHTYVAIANIAKDF